MKIKVQDFSTFTKIRVNVKSPEYMRYLEV